MAKEKTSKDEQIGFHKGSLAVLAKERQEMQRILGIVEQLMQMHIKSLKESGVDLEQAAKNLKGSKTSTKNKNRTQEKKQERNRKIY